ncbi:lysozyme family protein [Elizabethkingia anophelis]|uniref:hypothetical protein n=1 Tax=Elizabethkingia anophelis TaxID=1117645 RepID=UPI003892A32A
MKLKIYLLLSGVLIFAVLGYLFFLNKSVEDDYENSFDFPLIEESNKAFISGDAKDFVKINKKYLDIAYEKKYKEGEALCYIYIAKLKMNTGHFKEAFSFLIKAENLLMNSKNNVHMAILANEFSILNSFMQTIDGATSYSNKAIGYIDKVKKSELKIHIQSDIYINRGNINILNDSALVYYYKAKKLLQPNDVTINALIANQHLWANRTDSAKISIQRILNIINKEKGNNTEYSFVYSTITSYNIRIKNYTEAEKYGQKALRLILQEKQTQGYFVQYVYSQLADLYKAKDDIAKENFYKDLYNTEVHNLNKELTEVTSLMLEKRAFDIKLTERKAKNKEIFFIILMLTIGLVICLFAYKLILGLQLKKRHLKRKADNIKKNVTVQMYDKLILLAKRNDNSFLVNFQEVYPDFITNLLSINPDLESTELAFCALLKLNFSSREIANYTFIQIASVQQRKRRLRKRLNIPVDVDVYDFLNKL